MARRVISQFSAWRLVGLALIVAGSLVQIGDALPAQVRGGSNWNFYKIDDNDCWSYRKYGIVVNYHLAKAETDRQLQAIYDSGQRRLRLVLWFATKVDPWDAGWVVSSGPNNMLDTQTASNFVNLLTKMKTIGFEHVIVAFAPWADNYAGNWTAWNDYLFEADWNFINNTRQLIRSVGIPYLIDLGNEHTPWPNQPHLILYDKRLYGNYTWNWGTDDTLGFSLVGAQGELVPQIPEIYSWGKGYPKVFDVHFYGHTAGRGSEYEQFLAVDQAFKGIGLSTVPWIIGETFYNDHAAAYDIRRAMDKTGRPVQYLMQWPIHRGNWCQTSYIVGMNAFNAYIDRGF